MSLNISGLPARSIVDSNRQENHERGPYEGFLVGAYFIDEELILRRRFEFPQGVVKRGLMAFPNTIDYLIHIIENSLHQLPLVENVIVGEHGRTKDDIDIGIDASVASCSTSAQSSVESKEHKSTPPI